MQISGAHVDVRGYPTISENNFLDKRLAATLLEKLHLVLQRHPINPRIYVKIQEVFNELEMKPSRDLESAIEYGIERYRIYGRAETMSRVS